MVSLQNVSQAAPIRRTAVARLFLAWQATRIGVTILLQDSSRPKTQACLRTQCAPKVVYDVARLIEIALP